MALAHEERMLISVFLIFLIGMISVALFFTSNKETHAIGMGPIRARDAPRDNHGWTGEYGYRGSYGLTFSDCYCITRANNFRIDTRGYGVEGDFVQYIGQTTPEYCMQECRKRCEEPCAGRYYYLSSELFKQ